MKTTFEEPVVTLSLRLPFLVAGLAGLALGLTGLVRALPILGGQAPWPKHFLIGALITPPNGHKTSPRGRNNPNILRSRLGIPARIL